MDAKSCEIYGEKNKKSSPLTHSEYWISLNSFVADLRENRFYFEFSQEDRSVLRSQFVAALKANCCNLNNVVYRWKCVWWYRIRGTPPTDQFEFSIFRDVVFTLKVCSCAYIPNSRIRKKRNVKSFWTGAQNIKKKNAVSPHFETGRKKISILDPGAHVARISKTSPGERVTFRVRTAYKYRKYMPELWYAYTDYYYYYYYIYD